LCGLVGLKPTYGRVSAAGVIPLSRSLDHVGPITTRVLDAALLLQVLCRTSAGGADQAAPWPEDFLAQVEQSPRALRGGIPRSFFFDELDSGVAAAIEQALGVVRTLVADLREVALEPDTDRTLQALESYRVHRDTVEASPDLYQPETLRRIRSGENITPADYQQALARLQAARQNIGRWFADMDFLITPTTPIPAPAIAELKEHPENLRPRELLLLRNTRPFNVWGLPAVSVPCGFSERGLPIGLQIAGPPGREDLVLRLAHAYEQATVWHRRRPALRLD
jgi:aspartyl-tRNA(Asn)/glutamyl-tRNA(Gln) amidotransferase subunit A